MTDAPERSWTAVQATAPVRVDFAGGWTDVPPFSAREGGVVVNAAIALRSHARLEPTTGATRLEARDIGASLECHDAAALAGGGPLALLKAALRAYPTAGPCTLSTWSDAPPGSGLGSSGSMGVALAAVLAHVRGETLAPDALAHRAWHLEAVEAGIAGGKQDQYGSALGGFHLLRFDDPAVRAEPLALDPAFLDELARHAVLCYTGTSRLSSTTITRVIDGYERGDATIVAAFHAMKDAALLVADALRRGDLAAVGRLLTLNWAAQQRLDPIMCTPAMAQLEAAMADCGLLGAKATGSGAGGCMFFLVRRPDDAERAARALGATVLPVTWNHDGVTVC